jgi:hypothetical protein
MSMVHIDCLLASHECKVLLKSNNLKFLNYFLENPYLWNIIKSSVNEAYIEGHISRLVDKSGKLKKKSLWENLEQLLNFLYFEKLSIFSMRCLVERP